MKKMIMILLLSFPAIVSAHDCHCDPTGGMETISRFSLPEFQAELEAAIERAAAKADAALACKNAELRADMLAGYSVYSGDYNLMKREYTYLADECERLLESAIKGAR